MITKQITQWLLDALDKEQQMAQYKPGDQVVIDDDSWDNLNKVGRIVEVQGFHAVVLAESGETLTLALNQIKPQSFLSE